ncbi:MAG: error-prone DNA polymerase [Oceanicoccus sp.]|jgi:error-prone DNA polymerase
MNSVEQEKCALSGLKPSKLEHIKPTQDYAELHCMSNFTFLRGASHPEELVNEAASLGYKAIAITDECSLAGVVRAHVAAKDKNIKLLVGSEFFLTEGIHLVLLASNKKSYTQISGLISRARLASPKGSYTITLEDFKRETAHFLTLWLIDDFQDDDSNSQNMIFANELRKLFPENLWMGITLSRKHHEQQRYLKFYQIAAQYHIPMTACGNIHMHSASRKPLQDVLTSIRFNNQVSQMGKQLLANGEQFLHPIRQLKAIYPLPLLQETLLISSLCEFNLDSLQYQYPDEVVPPGKTAKIFLRELTEEGATKRWPEGVPNKVVLLIEKELALISELKYEQYFLTVYDIVQFARNQNILCQGRGSAANSAVCYCLFITEVDPARGQLLFERFISKERDEPPDIDVDFEHERREEVMQYIYRKYGRQHAALAATVITYRPRSAVRAVGKALGLDQGLIDKLAKSLSWWNKLEQLDELLNNARIKKNAISAQLFLQLVGEILGFPRHLSQHVGGFIISRDPISHLVPLENAVMENRTVIQWDKTDLEALGLMKVDILALGMLSAIRKSLGYISTLKSREQCNGSTSYSFQLEDIPSEDPATYQMLCRADSIGVFQIESRAQMSMLPRLRPQKFYDLVIQIAIIRPGPIQGGMVHPFLRRRQGLELVSYANSELREVLERTLGVPIFQEQVIKLAMVAAGFSGGEADQLRRAMASRGRNGHLDMFRDKLVNGMLERGYSIDFAERLFSQIQGFGAYGFPESHSASFALLAYASSWIKCHHPGAFFCGLLNSQPMGFYAPTQLIQDAKRHDVIVLPICVNHSQWDHQLTNSHILRLGFRLIKGIHKATAKRIIDARHASLFDSMPNLLHRVNLNRHERNCLVRADAFGCFNSHRYQSQWEISGVEETRPLLAFENNTPLDDDIILDAPQERDDIRWDYSYTGVSLRRHPMALIRQDSYLRRCCSADNLPKMKNGSFVQICGLVTCRQRPSTASGVLFITLEDETGYANIIVWENTQNFFRQIITNSRILLVKGTLQCSELLPNVEASEQTPVIHVVANFMEDLTHLMPLKTTSHDFH